MEAYRPSPTVIVGLLVVGVVILGLMFSGHISFGPMPAQSQPLPPIDPSLKTEVGWLASGSQIDTQLAVWGLWIVDRLYWVAFLGLTVGAALYLTHVGRDLGMRVMRTAGYGLLILLLLPVVVDLLPRLIAVRDGLFASHG